MSGQLRALRNRIRSVENTKKITRAMEMVAAAKLRRFQDMMQKSRAYTEGLQTLLKRLSGVPSAGEHPFINPDKRPAVLDSLPLSQSVKKKESARGGSASGGKIALVVMTSDTGLCGSYNNDLANMTQRFIREYEQPAKEGGSASGGKPVMIAVGKSGGTTLKNMGCPAKYSFTDIRASRVEEILAQLRLDLEKLYLSGEADSVHVIYSHFKTLTTFQAITEKLLPLSMSFPRALGGNPGSPTKDFGDDSKNEAQDYIFEPSAEIVFEKLVPQFFDAKLRMIFLEAIVSEQIARMTAMHQATKNAKEMIDGLVLKRNKARQASITKELIEIVSGSQALKIK